MTETEIEVYSLRQLVPDGLLGPSPRWVLHLVKFAQHAAPAFVIVALWSATGHAPDYFLAGFVSGWVVYCAIVTRKRLHLGKHGRANAPDWIFDASFPLAVTALGSLAQGALIEGLTLALIAVGLYVTLHPQGNP